MPTPLPDPATLLDGLMTLERRLSELEGGFAAQSYTRASSDGKIQAVANGLGRLISLTIHPTLVATLTATALADQVKAVINAALTASRQATEAAMRTAALTLALPGLPARGQPPPDFTAFASTASSLSAKIIASNPCQTTNVFTCKSGPVTAVVNGRRLLISLVYASPLPNFVPHLEDSTIDAVNCAIDKGTNRPDETPGTIGGIPGGSANFKDLVLYASHFLNVETHAIVRNQAGTGFGMIGNAGTFLTDIDLEAEVGNVLSRAKVNLGLHAKVHGFIRTASTVVGQSLADITGPVVQNAVVVLPELSLNVAFPAANQGQLKVGIGKQVTAAPGYYTKIDIENNGTLFVSSGVYFCNDFDLDPGARVVFNTAGGPVFLYVKNTFFFNGSFVDSAGGFPNVFVGYVGTLLISLNTAFSGTLVAPKAKIELESVPLPGHAGAFHAKEIEANPGTIRHQPFPIAYENLPSLAPSP